MISMYLITICFYSLLTDMTNRLVSAVVSLFQADKLFGALALQCPDRMPGFIGCLAQNMRADRIRHKNK